MNVSDLTSKEPVAQGVLTQSSMHITSNQRGMNVDVTSLCRIDVHTTLYQSFSLLEMYSTNYSGRVFLRKYRGELPAILCFQDSIGHWLIHLGALQYCPLHKQSNNIRHSADIRHLISFQATALGFPVLSFN